MMKKVLFVLVGMVAVCAMAAYVVQPGPSEGELAALGDYYRWQAVAVGPLWDVSANQISHWMMNDDAADTHVDDNEEANDGTLTGGEDTADVTVAGKINTALHFDGTNTVDAGGAVIPAKTFSLSLWVRVTDMTSPTYFCGQYEFGHTGRVDMAVEANGAVSVQIGDQIISDAGFVTLNNWHHIIVSRTNATCTVYVDADLIMTDTLGNDTLQTENFIIARIIYFGDIDDVRVFDSILTQAQRDGLYNDGDGTEADSGS